MKGFKKSENKIERYDASIQHEAKIYIEEDENYFNISISFDGHGYIKFLVGVPKFWHNKFTGEDITNTKESCLEEVKSYYLDIDTMYYYFKDIERMEAEED